jgi:hypothetical protein
MISEIDRPVPASGMPTPPLITHRCYSAQYLSVNSETPLQQLCSAEAKLVVNRPGRDVQLEATVRTDPMMAVVIIALVALGVVGMALYVLLSTIRTKMR